jgi:hypothetical protein
MIKEQFNDNGYIIIKTDLIRDKAFKILCQNIYNSLDNSLKNSNLKILRGYIMGNLNVYPGIYGDQILDLLKEKKILSLIENILDLKLNNMEIRYGGNLSLSRKGEQHFHTDGSYSKKMYLVSLATENIDHYNGPTRVCIGSHKKNIPYWKFVFSNKIIKSITLKKGDIIIRNHNLWHKGTKNNSKNNRLLLSFFIFPKSSNYQINHQETKEVSLSSNFFKNTFYGYIQEYIYSRIRFLHFIIRFFKSLLKNK